MKISYNWLKDYADTTMSPDEVAKVLTNTGLEVEGKTSYQSIEGGLEGLVIGHVTSCINHPNANNLSLTTVDIGGERELPIVCGAPNVSEGQKVVVATPGTTLYMNGKEIKLQKTKIRGEISEGMICAEDEIGMGDDHEGIMVLDDDAPIGQKAKDYFQVETDTILEIDLTPNRIDGASHIGVARDLVAFLSQTKNIKLHIPPVDHFYKDNNNLNIDIQILNQEACQRYTGVTMTQVKVAPSPQWLQNRLKAVGLKPINNLVDISNYVLLETGHPLHFFDADKIEGHKILIKKVNEGTPFSTLDEQVIELSKDDLTISDMEKPLCVAGVLGGSNSGVTENTRNLFIESAYFDPRHIRNTAKRHGFNTDASYRFERGADPNITVYAIKRAVNLVKEIAGGQISSDIVDVYPRPVENCRVGLNFNQLYRMTGQEIPVKELRNILSALDITIEQETTDAMNLLIPTFRVDVTREVDVIEEILRIYGYNKIETPQKLNATLTYSDEDESEKTNHIISTMLTGQGFTEIMSNSLTKSAYYNDLNSFPNKKLVYLQNPLSSDLNSLRQTLLFGGLETIAHNINHQNPDLKLFEMGTCYVYNGSNEAQRNDLYHESTHLSLFLSGQFTPERWNTQQKPVDLFHLKGYLESILEKMGFQLRHFSLEEIENDIFTQGLRFNLKKHPLATAGMVHPRMLKKLGIESPVYFGDICWSKLLEIAQNKEIVYREVPRYPQVRRDLALLLDEEVPFKQIENLAYEKEKKYLKKVSLFDVYQGEKLGAHKKSYAVSFILQDEQQTLKDKQIDKIMDKLIKTFQEKLDAEIR